MSKYEIMFIVKATQDSSEVTKTADAMKDIISDNKSKVVDFKAIVFWSLILTWVSATIPSWLEPP